MRSNTHRPHTTLLPCQLPTSAAITITINIVIIVTKTPVQHQRRLPPAPLEHASIAKQLPRGGTKVLPVPSQPLPFTLLLLLQLYPTIIVLLQLLLTLHLLYLSLCPCVPFTFCHVAMTVQWATPIHAVVLHHLWTIPVQPLPTASAPSQQHHPRRKTHPVDDVSSLLPAQRRISS